MLFYNVVKHWNYRWEEEMSLSSSYRRTLWNPRLSTVHATMRWVHSELFSGIPKFILFSFQFTVYHAFFSLFLTSILNFVLQCHELFSQAVLDSLMGKYRSYKLIFWQFLHRNLKNKILRALDISCVPVFLFRLYMYSYKNYMHFFKQAVRGFDLMVDSSSVCPALCIDFFFYSCWRLRMTFSVWRMTTPTWTRPRRPVLRRSVSSRTSCTRSSSSSPSLRKNTAPARKRSEPQSQ